MGIKKIGRLIVTLAGISACFYLAFNYLIKPLGQGYMDNINTMYSITGEKNPINGQAVGDGTASDIMVHNSDFYGDVPIEDYDINKSAGNVVEVMFEKIPALKVLKDWVDETFYGGSDSKDEKSSGSEGNIFSSENAKNALEGMGLEDKDTGENAADYIEGLFNQ